MQIPALQRPVQASDIPLERLAGNPHLTEDQKTSEAARQFEAVMVKQILAETQKTVIPSKYADNSTASGIYHDMVSNQLADSISKSGSLGLAKSLEHQLSRQAVGKSHHPIQAGGNHSVQSALHPLHSHLTSIGAKHAHAFKPKKILVRKIFP